MNKNWKEKTCGDCFFRKDRECKRFPPSVEDCIDSRTSYPVVMTNFETDFPFTKACAEYKESNS